MKFQTMSKLSPKVAAVSGTVACKRGPFSGSMLVLGRGLGLSLLVAEGLCCKGVLRQVGVQTAFKHHCCTSSAWRFAMRAEAGQYGLLICSQLPFLVFRSPLKLINLKHKLRHHPTARRSLRPVPSCTLDSWPLRVSEAHSVSAKQEAHRQHRPDTDDHVRIPGPTTETFGHPSSTYGSHDGCSLSIRGGIVTPKERE